MRRKFRRFLWRKLVEEPLTEEFEYSLSQTRLTSMVGLSRSCGIWPRFDSDNSCLELLQSYAECPSSSFIRHSDVIRFLDETGGRGKDDLPKVEVLVFGNTTETVDEFSVKNLLEMGDRLRATKILSTNLAVQNQGITPIPIGLDFHSNFYKRDYFQKNRKMPLTQEAELLAIGDSASKFSERLSLCSIDWAPTSEVRKRIWDKLDRTACLQINGRVDRRNVWEQHARCQFVISPPGYGLDCHRIWEALALGCAVLVEPSPIDYMFVNLPVFIIDDWSQLDVGYLERLAQRVIADQYCYEICQAEYWRAFINGQLLVDGWGRSSPITSASNFLLR